MTERPILFSAPMVLALLAGRKTQTRRVVKPQPSNIWGRGVRIDDDRFAIHADFEGALTQWIHCPYGKPGDRLWVRETWQPLWADPDVAPVSLKSPGGWAIGYPATDGVQEWTDCEGGELTTKCRPSIHMPRWASRITLEVTGVRVERLQSITEADAKAEGVVPVEYDAEGDCWTATERARKTPHVVAYEYLWGEINGFDSWALNPWVWVVEFKRVTP